MKPTLKSLPLVLLLGLAFGPSSASAITKDDNTTALQTGTSWIGGTAPGTADVADWSGTYNTAGSLSATFGAGLDWGGISVGSISGTAAGLVTVGGTGAAPAFGLRVRGSGIDMSAANQNLVLNASFFTFNDSQTWNVASGRNLRLAKSGTGAANADVDGSNASAVITISGGGVVDLNQGGASGFADAAGYANYAGKWQVNSGATLRGLRNGATAFGSNVSADAIALNGGTLATGGIAGATGNWTWATPITLNTSTSSIIDNQNPSGANRFLKFNAAISGTGNVAFASTGAGTMSADNGFILTAANTNSGSVTINSGAFLRVGGISGTDTSTNAGTTGTLGDGSATNDVINNGTLTFSRSNTHTVSNDISGSGVVRVGGGYTGSATQDVTLSGTNTYTGATTVNNGTLRISGSTNTTAGAFTVGSGSAGTLVVTGTGVLTTTGALDLGSGTTGNTFTVDAGGDVNVGVLNNPWQTNTTVNGTLDVTGAYSVSTNAASPIAGSGAITAGSFTTGNVSTTVNFTNTGSMALAGAMTIAGTSSPVFNQSAGTIGTTNLHLNGTTSATYALTGGRINIGASGITGAGGTKNVNLGAGTVGARGANWSSSLNMGLTDAGTGTTFNTLDSVGGVTGQTITLSGNLTGAGRLNKDGAGTLTLSGVANSYGGTTSVNAGTLLVNGTHTGGGLYSVAGGATLGGTGSTASAVTVALLGALAPGASAGQLGTGLLTLNNTTALNWELANPNLGNSTLSDRVDVTGNLVLDGILNVTALTGFGTPIVGDKWRLFNYTGSLTDNLVALGTLPSLSGGLFYSIDTSTANQVNLVVNAVPEPGTFAMLLFGVVGLWLMGRKRAA